MGSFQDALVKALPGIIGTGVAVIGGKLIDAISPPKSSDQLFQEYYKAVENSNLPKTEQEAESILSGRNRSPPHLQQPLLRPRRPLGTIMHPVGTTWL